jgi:hypothetical protein
VGSAIAVEADFWDEELDAALDDFVTWELQFF